jgi:hypothetical protein
MDLSMKINFGKGLLRLYVIISVFWVIAGLLDNYEALAPHVGINYWTNESYNARIKEDCDAEVEQSLLCKINEISESEGLGPSDKEIAEAPKEFFYFYIALPIILLLVFSAFYKAIRWILIGFIHNKND